MSGTEGKKPKTLGFAELAALYRRRILKGELAPGDPMPTLKAATETHGVAKGTVVRAYDVLKREGLITARGGATTTVASGGIYLSGADRVARVERGEDGLLSGERTVENTAGYLSVDDPAVAEALGLELRDEIVMRSRVSERDGKRTILQVSCYHLRAVSAVQELPDVSWSSRDWKRTHEERTGRKVHASPQRYGARIARPEELRKLHIFSDATAARAVLVVTTEFSDETGPLAYWEDVYAPGLTRPADSPGEGE